MITNKAATEYSYSLEDLKIKPKDIAILMGYDSEVPPDIEGIIDEELSSMAVKSTIKGGFSIYEARPVKEGNVINIDEVTFNVGRSIWHYLKKSEKIAVFACTAGSYISDRSKELMNTGMLLEGYTADVIGSVAVEKGMDKIWEDLKQECDRQEENLTNRYNPGYCNWDVAEQHKLFSLLPGGFCGITLNESALMIPAKSLSGFIGVGKDVIFKEYTCHHCSSVNCIYRFKK